MSSKKELFLLYPALSAADAPGFAGMTTSPTTAGAEASARSVGACPFVAASGSAIAVPFDGERIGLPEAMASLTISSLLNFAFALWKS